jgi:hypothetical protein
LRRHVEVDIASDAEDPDVPLDHALAYIEITHEPSHSVRLKHIGVLTFLFVLRHPFTFQIGVHWTDVPVAITDIAIVRYSVLPFRATR